MNIDDAPVYLLASDDDLMTLTIAIKRNHRAAIGTIAIPSREAYERALAEFQAKK
jgi:hypothetical protein